jgi:hypothetical protein
MKRQQFFSARVGFFHFVDQVRAQTREFPIARGCRLHRR